MHFENFPTDLQHICFTKNQSDTMYIHAYTYQQPNVWKQIPQPLICKASSTQPINPTKAIQIGYL